MGTEDKQKDRRWERTSIYLGSVEDNSKSKVEFKALKDIPKVKLISSSCGCTSVKYSNDTLIAVVSNKKAKHLEEQKFKRTIQVHYEDRSVDEFLITGKII